MITNLTGKTPKDDDRQLNNHNQYGGTQNASNDIEVAKPIETIFDENINHYQLKAIGDASTATVSSTSNVEGIKNRNRNNLSPCNHAFKIIFVISSFLILSFTLSEQFRNHHKQDEHIKNERNGEILPKEAAPFSNQLPHDLHRYTRGMGSLPGPAFPGLLQEGTSRTGIPLPTNAWYQNLLMVDSVPTEANRAYTIPYEVDFVGPIPGLRMQFPFVTMGNDKIVQTMYDGQTGLTLGGSVGGDEDASYTIGNGDILGDNVPEFSPLGVHLHWKSASDDGSSMTSPIIRGMPYGTMVYNKIKPIVASELPLSAPPIIDGSTKLECGSTLNDVSASVRVEKDIELYFADSDFTWLIFYSRPVYVKCVTSESGAQLIVTEDENDNDDQSTKLIVRAALLNICTNGSIPQNCQYAQDTDTSVYSSTLRDHSNVFPYSPKLKFVFPEDSEDESVDSDSSHIQAQFDWGSMRMDLDTSDDNDEELIMFALPHHAENIQDSTDAKLGHCFPSLSGNACLVKGKTWEMQEELPELSFVSDTTPDHTAIAELANAALQDIHYEIPDNYMRGAGDTYFSGKMLAKLGRIVAITKSLKELSSTNADDITDKHRAMTVRECAKASLPSDDDFDKALDRLRSGVEIWLTNTASAPFVYDNIWGGMVSCGCQFNGDTRDCDNVYPNCPAFGDPGMNFGNGFYNDHHFHLGYHIYSAAIVAKYDHEWGRQYFDKVLLLIRDIANPSSKDTHFPQWRHKDWYLGSSWASGLVTWGGQPNINGRNQESSSEAIAAYEGIGLYGMVMADVWGNGKSKDSDYNKNAIISRNVRDMGRLMTGTEVRAADRYWHVYDSPHRVYPKEYTEKAVGILWNNMVEFQTWFGNAPYLVYGIQLLPLTTISEKRDNLDWVKELYPPFAASCESASACEEEGWSILQYAMLATIGHKDLAINKTLALDPDVYDSASGNGHSMTNSLWYIATRPDISPLELTAIAAREDPNAKITCGCPDSCTQSVLDRDATAQSCENRIKWIMNDKGKSQIEACSEVGGLEFAGPCGPCNPETCKSVSSISSPPPSKSEESADMMCGCNTCTEAVKDNDADGHSCISRIEWLVENMSMTKHDACAQIGGKEFPKACGGCDPDRYDDEDNIDNLDDESCPHCTQTVCESSLNQCNPDSSPYLCSTGPTRGGCSATPWVVADSNDGICFECCKVGPKCVQKIEVDETNGEGCPVCSKAVCKRNQCNVSSTPYLCSSGSSIGGCSETPWAESETCTECCKLTSTCAD